MKPVIVLVAGASGSGKSTVVRSLKEGIGADQCTVVPLDMFYNDHPDLSPEEKAGLNYDHPDALDWSEIYYVVRSLKEGNKAQLPFYDFVTHSRDPKRATTLEPQKLIIVEGIMALWDERLLALADYSVFVEVSLDICLQRRQERDTAPVANGGRGRTHASVLAQWEQVRKMFLTYFEATRHHADLWIPRGGHNERGVHLLVHAIKCILSEQNTP